MGDARAVYKKGDAFCSISDSREQPHFCLAAGCLSGFFTFKFAPSGFLFLSLHSF